MTREQFDAACRYLLTSGIPLVSDIDRAWDDFAGWRVNYDAVVESLAVMLVAPPSPWTTVTTAVSPYTSGDAVERRRRLPGHGPQAGSPDDRADERPT